MRNKKFHNLKQALIIFVRNPVLGKVKTRLAATAGEEHTLHVYRQLLQHTHDITAGLSCDKFVFYAEDIVEEDMWEKSLYQKNQQQGANLGERMQHAFSVLFEEGYGAVVIIGSDCIELTTALIGRAFSTLAGQDMVIGPSADGGYYLLGLTQMDSRLFENISWSSNAVLQQTLAAAAELHRKPALLEQLHDVDTEADWNRYLAGKKTNQQLVFVYNAGSDLFSTVTDYLHKLLSPATYSCSLCALTHHHAGMKRTWKDFTEQLPVKTLFLHSDEFIHRYPQFQSEQLPAIFLEEANSMQVLLPAVSLNGFQDIEELKTALRHQLHAHDLDHHTGI